MRHARPIWLAFALAVVAVFAAMGWITAAVLRLDAAEADSRRRAQLEENVRLALWRMDSALAPLIAAEHARPHAAFRERRPNGKAVKGQPAEPVLLNEWFDAPPPPLPGETASFARLYFQLQPSGRITSPHPAGSGAKDDGPNLARLSTIAPPDDLLAALPPAARPGENTALTFNNASIVGNNVGSQLPNTDEPLPQSQQQAGVVYPNTTDQQLTQQQADVPNQPVAQNWEPQQLAQAKQQREAMQQSLRNRQEYNARATNNSIQYQLQNGFNGNYANLDNVGTLTSDAAPSVMHALWCGPARDELILARRVAANGGGDAVQGCWVDWPAVRDWLLKGSADLLPAARLEPVTDGATEPGDARLLASLPVRLVPGEVATAANVSSSPLRLSLVVAWACVLLASAAVGGLLRGVVSLSERRGAFVSAVTHELRTPLTTLRMYTEMLEGGMVEDDSQRRHYLGTLRAEADRLGHLVENVLAYSRLERHRATTSETVESPLGDLLARPVERLSERARQAGMTLDADLPEGVAAVRVRTNPTSLEQILFNLVDNACKYAAGSGERTIHLSAAGYGDVVRLTVRDHGPGITDGREPRLFKAFSKSVQEAANSAPGLGLGLALSKRLAHAMGAKLELDTGCRDGTCFALTLPTA